MGTIYNKFAYYGYLPPSENAYKYLIFDIYTIRGTTLDYTSLSKIEFKDSAGNVFNFPQGTEVICSNPCYTGEGPEHLVDGLVTTKVTAYWNSYGKVCRFWIILPESRYLDLERYNQFSWYTEDDDLARDPVTWRLMAIREGGTLSDAILLSAENDYNVTIDRESLAYTTTVSSTALTTQYRYIKMFIPKIRSNNTYMQFSDIRFYNGSTVYSYPSGTSITGSLSPSGSGETVAKLIDNNASTKYCCNWNSTTGCIIVITLPSTGKINLATYSTFSWYTANDIQSRDPVTWSLFMANNSDFSDSILVDWQADYNVTTSRSVEAYNMNILHLLD